MFLRCSGLSHHAAREANTYNNAKYGLTSTSIMLHMTEPNKNSGAFKPFFVFTTVKQTKPMGNFKADNIHCSKKCKEHF